MTDPITSFGRNYRDDEHERQAVSRQARDTWGDAAFVAILLATIVAASHVGRLILSAG